MATLQSLSRPLLEVISRLGADPDDGEDVRLHKSLLVGGSLMFILAGVLWGLLYVAFGEPVAGAIPLAYACISLVSVALFAATGRYALFRSSQFVLILLLPFLLQLALGGFVSSSAVVLWSLLCPLGALLFDEPRRAPRWFAAFAAIVVTSGVVQPYLNTGNHLPLWLVIAFFVMNMVAISAIAFTLLYSFVAQKEATLGMLRAEQEKSEGLLLNILPRDIAAVLKTGRHTIAEHYEDVSILFADVVNFTPLSAQMRAEELVGMLNEVFSHFDGLAEKYDVEKIKTIGDCYMAASGVPRPRPDSARVLVRMALEIREYIASREFAGRRLTIRIGINSGPIVAGVIGRRKFIYDLWGDAVNVASRMESTGIEGAIQVTRATYERIKDQFVCESKGMVNVKGKGPIEVWHVTREAGAIATP
ncbi:MAG: adenylate/guanylate cyclase domain-containing protein [Betaproteobacteria bacterium]|nr:adenylate/guanylate cyclase domain-containing protein [Betaproteobacteria bacterium]